MGKKKKTYVKPEMKIIEVKTEGVIAASGGEIIVPPGEETDRFCASNQFRQAEYSHHKKIGESSSSFGDKNNNCNNMVVGVEYYTWNKYGGGDIHFWKNADGSYTYKKCGGC